ncbi:uncharacterized protein LOC121760462 [Salvia splendens]|uniref:uncharacterized protein LOC121760462 n=1 Tax=Salvia splendens TaxID=180675 RepID=UPI001C259D5C|nr:uncharacterized protein LOC121760462 [Salvia splendens]
MPYSIYKKLENAKLVETNMEIQLADGSCIYPEGVLDDKLVKVNKFMYPADFFVIKTTEPGAEESVGILLGRPFLSTASTVIDVLQGTMKLSFNGEQLTFEVDKAVRKPQDNESIQTVDAISPRKQKYPEKKSFKEPPSSSTEGEQLKREVAEWFDTTMTGEMNDQAIRWAIMKFCQPSQPTESKEVTQLRRVEKLPDQAAPLKGMLKENPSPTRKLISAPTSPMTLKNLTNQANNKPVNLNLQEQEGKSKKKLRPDQGVVKWKTHALIETHPELYMHPMVKKGETPHFNRQYRISPALRLEEFMVGEEELLFQC